jgi:16S rRNA (cytosine1402-N4)-methyltransferase
MISKSRVSQHQPVMASQVLELLASTDSSCPPFEGIIVDGTVGGGGHSREMLQTLSSRGSLYCFDRDPFALELAKGALAEDPRLHYIHGSYADILHHLDPGTVCGILLDLGLSFDQLQPERGFSYLHEAPLDMRFDPDIESTAYDVVNHYKVEKLREVFFKYGEEPLSPRIARRVVETRAQGAIRTTVQLAQVVSEAVPERFRMKALSRIFQALRIEVNSEIEHLERGIEACWTALKTGGIICILSYHSIEDRRVKHFFAAQAKGCICPPRFPVCACGRKPTAKILTPSPLTPAPPEIRVNPQSRSAKLRAARKIVSV